MNILYSSRCCIDILDKAISFYWMVNSKLAFLFREGSNGIFKKAAKIRQEK